jgi:hypothetical protein
MRQTKPNGVFVLLLLFLLTQTFSFGASRAFGDTVSNGAASAHEVTDTSDNPSNPAPGTLRYLVLHASDRDVIRFAEGKNNIALKATLEIGTSVTILGPATLTQTGSGAVVILKEQDREVTLTNLTLSGGTDKNMGYAGSGVINRGTMRLSYCTMTGNRTYWQGAGVNNTKTLTMTNCIVKGNFSNTGGGGVYSRGTLLIQDSAVEDNLCYDDFGGGIANEGTLTVKRCSVKNNTANSSTTQSDIILGTNPGYGGGIGSLSGAVVIEDSDVSGNAGHFGGGIYGRNGSVTIQDSSVSGNTAGAFGGGIYCFKGSVTLRTSRITDNSLTADYYGGGLCLSSSTASLLAGTVIRGNAPDQIHSPAGSSWTSDGTCTVGSAPNKSATAFSGYSGGTEPEPRSIVGDADVAAVKTALANPQSGLYAVIERAFAADLGKTTPEKSTSLAGMAATLYDANTFENVALTSADLSVEYTASWPSTVRYYALFARADGTGYELADRGVKFELQAGQNLPDGVTPPDFYVPGEGLMTWRNIVTDNGSYDLNPAAGVVTIRVCSVRAAEVAGDKGSGGGCDAGAGAGFAPLVLLLAVPLCAFARPKGSARK